MRRALGRAAALAAMAWMAQGQGARRTLSVPVTFAGAPGAAPVSGECVASIAPANPITALAFQPGSTAGLAAGGYREIVVWDTQRGALVRRIPLDHTAGQVRALAFTPDGKRLAVAGGLAGRSGFVTLLDFESGAAQAPWESSKDEFSALAMNASGTLVAAGGADGAVRVWTLADRTLAARLTPHAGAVSGLAFSPDGKLLASGSVDGTVEVWRVEGWKPAVTLPQVPGEPVAGVAFSSDGALLAFSVGGAAESGVRIWRTEAAEPPKEMNARQAQRWAVQSRQTRLVDAGAGLPLGVTWIDAARAGANPNRPLMLVPATDNSIKVMGPNAPQLAAVLRRLEGHSDWVYAIAVAPDGERFASAGADQTVRLWRTADGVLLATLAQLAGEHDAWIAVTPRGGHASSSPADLACRASAALPAGVIERLANPEVVRQALAAKAPSAPGPAPGQAPAKKQP